MAWDIVTWNFTQSRLIELLTAPYYYPEMIWIVLPLITTLIVMQFYFGRYDEDELGWNTAVGNTLVLLFVALDLFRHIYNLPPADILNFILYPVQTTVILLVGFEGIALFFADFFRFLPKKLAFFISSPLPVNLTAYLAIVLVYSKISVDIYTLYAALLIFTALFIVIYSLQFLVNLMWDASKSS